MSNKENRSKIIVRTSIIGIIANIALSALKAVIGTLTNSIAITLDAVNNLSDAASSIITIVGTKLAAKEPDKKHPFGYGRIEYLSAMAIAFLVLYAGITSLVESVKKIIEPSAPEYTGVVLILVAVGVIVKIVLGRYVKSVGVKVDSDSLVNSGEDATLDSIISASTLVAAGIYLKFGVSLEAYLGAIISLVIIKAGFDMLKETVSRILGEGADIELVKRIKMSIVDAFPDVKGVYDVTLSDFGPNEYKGSVHIEVLDTNTANDLDELLRAIQLYVFTTHHIALTAIGVYSINTHDPRAIEVREDVMSIALSHEHVRQIHGFYLNDDDKTIRFDVVVSFNAKSRYAVYQEVLADVQSHYPDYSLNCALDTDYSEL